MLNANIHCIALSRHAFHTPAGVCVLVCLAVAAFAAPWTQAMRSARASRQFNRLWLARVLMELAAALWLVSSPETKHTAVAIETTKGAGRRAVAGKLSGSHGGNGCCLRAQQPWMLQIRLAPWLRGVRPLAVRLPFTTGHNRAWRNALTALPMATGVVPFYTQGCAAACGKKTCHVCARSCGRCCGLLQMMVLWGVRSKPCQYD